MKGEKEIVLFKTLIAKNGSTTSTINFPRMAKEWNLKAVEAVPAIIGNYAKQPRRSIFKKTETQLEAYHKKNMRTQEIKNTMETFISPSSDLISSLLREDFPGTIII